MQRLHYEKVGGVLIPLLVAKYVHQEQTVSVRLYWSCLGAMCCGARVTDRQEVGGVDVTKIDKWHDTKGYTTFGREAQSKEMV